MSNISFVGGAETSIIEYCKNAPRGMKIVIVQTDEPKGKNEHPEIYGYDNISLYTIKGFNHKLAFLKKNKITSALLQFIFLPLLFFVLKHTCYRSLWKRIGYPKYVYLFNNHCAQLFPKKVLIVGSTHVWGPVQGNKLGSIYTKLAQNRLIWRNVKRYHVFPNYRWFLKNLCVPGKAIANGVDITRSLEIENIPKGQHVNFLYYGKLEPCKGVMKAIEAFKIVKEKYPNAELHIAGTGSLSEKISKTNNIRFHGFLEQKELLSLIRSCNCSVFPTTCDTFGLVVIESIFNGLFVILSDYLKDVFEEFEKMGALITSPNEVEAIAKRMEAYIENGGMTMQTMKEAQKLIMDTYSWEANSRELYNWITSED